MYTVASPDPDPTPKGGGQLPNPNECNSTLTSVTRGTYPYPDTYIYKCLVVVWNLGSPYLQTVNGVRLVFIGSFISAHVLFG